MTIIYTFIENTKDKSICDFCDNNPSIGQIKARNTQTNKHLGTDYICGDCKIKFDNNEIEKCLKCGRLVKADESDEECLCEFLKEKYGDTELMIEEETITVKLEKQLNFLSIEKEQVEEELQTEQEAHLAGIDATANWYKREFEKEKEALLTKIKKLETEIERLRKLAENCNCQIVEAKIEVPPKSFNL